MPSHRRRCRAEGSKTYQFLGTREAAGHGLFSVVKRVSTGVKQRAQ